MSTNVQNLKQIGGGHRKNGQKFVDLTWNDPIWLTICRRTKYAIMKKIEGDAIFSRSF